MALELLVGVDLGTSSVKVVATGPEGRPVGSATRPYPILTPAPGHAEQDPATWCQQAAEAVREVLAAAPAGAVVRAVGVTGQMHGLVAVDQAGVPVRPAVIWPDTRSVAACRQLRDRVGAGRLAAITGAPPATGLLAASLLWLREAEPEAYQRVRTVLAPKDYLRWWLTGEIATDPTDASGTLLLDIAARTWSEEILGELRIDPRLLPPIREPAALAGSVTAPASARTGLPVGTPVVTGAGDLMAGALALGVVGPGTGASILGTGGQLITVAGTARVDPRQRLQTFVHAAPEQWLLLGAVLAAGAALDWLAGVLGSPGADLPALVAEAEKVPPGADGMVFLPYLNGVRTPTVDPHARGCFVGLGLGHGRGHLVRAVLEGVAFAIRDGLEAMRDLGVAPPSLVAAGGGARLPLWNQIQADVYGLPLVIAGDQDHSARGAARLAAAGTGGPDSAAGSYPERVVVSPDPGRQLRYEEMFAHYQALYPALADSFAGLAGSPAGGSTRAG